MKKLLAILTVAAGALVLTPAEAQAGPNNFRPERRPAGHCDDCHQQLYRVRYIAGYARDGCPVYKWKTVFHLCRPGHDHDHGRNHDRDGRGGHDHRGHGHGKR